MGLRYMVRQPFFVPGCLTNSPAPTSEAVAAWHALVCIQTDKNCAGHPCHFREAIIESDGASLSLMCSSAARQARVGF